MSAKASSASTSIDHSEHMFLDNVVPIINWTETTAKTGYTVVKCSQDLVVAANIVSDAAIDGALEYGKELRDLNAKLVAVMSGGLEHTSHLIMGEKTEGPSQDAVNALMTQWQNVMNVGKLQAERQIKTALNAYQTLAAIPSNFLGH